MKKTGTTHPILVVPDEKKQACVFKFYNNWLHGETLHLTRDNFGYRGAGLHLFGRKQKSRGEFVKLLVDFEGLKSSREKMNMRLDYRKKWKPEHPNILIGAEYDGIPDDHPPVTAPFGSGCMQLLPLLKNLNAAQGATGATDIAMRRFLPPDIMMFTMTKPMLERLCALDERSFLHKPFWKSLKRIRDKHQTDTEF